MLLWIGLVMTAGAGVGGTYELGKKIDTIALDSIRGDVKIRIDGEQKRNTIIATDRQDNTNCKFDIEESGSIARVVFGSMKKEGDSHNCTMEITVNLLPKSNVSVDLTEGFLDTRSLKEPFRANVGSGRIRIQDHQSDLNLIMGVGEVAVEGTGTLNVKTVNGNIRGTWSGTTEFKTDTGHIELTGLDGPSIAAAGIGNVLLTFDKLPTEDLSFSAGKGNIVIDLPDDQPIKPGLMASGGTSVCDLPEGGEIDVVALTGNGSIRVH